MTRYYRSVLPALTFSFLCSAAPPALAVTPEELADAKREAEYYEAKKDTAIAAAELAEAQSQARLASEKAELDADKARSDYYKSLLPTAPDPQKYAITPPASVSLLATANYRNIEAIKYPKKGLTSNISKLISDAIAEHESCNKPNEPNKPKLIFLEDSKIKSSVGLYKVTMVFLNDANKQISTKKKDLEKALNPPKIDTANISPLAPDILFSLAETAVSFAKILKTQYLTATKDLKPLADDMLSASVIGELIKRKIPVMDTEAITDTPLDPALLSGVESNQANPPNGTLLGASALLMKNIIEAKGLLAKPINMPNKNAEAAKKELTELIELTHKQLLTFYIIDAQGGVPFDIAQKGEVISDKLKTDCVYTLTLKVLSSDVDTVAADGLFKGYRVSMATNTAARWKLVLPDGNILASGVENVYTPWSRVQIPN